jgi:hypothetical protein
MDGRLQGLLDPSYVVQETLLKAHRAIHQFTGQPSPDRLFAGWPIPGSRGFGRRSTRQGAVVGSLPGWDLTTDYTDGTDEAANVQPGVQLIEQGRRRPDDPLAQILVNQCKAAGLLGLLIRSIRAIRGVLD